MKHFYVISLLFFFAGITHFFSIQASKDATPSRETNSASNHAQRTEQHTIPTPLPPAPPAIPEILFPIGPSSLEISIQNNWIDQFRFLTQRNNFLDLNHAIHKIVRLAHFLPTEIRHHMVGNVWNRSRALSSALHQSNLLKYQHAALFELYSAPNRLNSYRSLYFYMISFLDFINQVHGLPAHQSVISKSTFLKNLIKPCVIREYHIGRHVVRLGENYRFNYKKLSALERKEIHRLMRSRRRVVYPDCLDSNTVVPLVREGTRLANFDENNVPILHQLRLINESRLTNESHNESREHAQAARPSSDKGINSEKDDLFEK